MKIDRVFVLLLVVMLPMTGCFEDAVGEADAQGDTSDDTTDSGTNSGTQTSQSRTWYSSGGIYEAYWNDGSGVGSGGSRCVDWGPIYNQSTGDYEGEDCREYGYPDQASDWNVTACTESGGVPVWNNLDSSQNGTNGTNYEYRYAPYCELQFATIVTNAGEALLIYEWSGSWSIETTCNGVSRTLSYSSSLYGKEYHIATGSAMNCTHQLQYSASYQNSDIPSYIWSIVYAIQDVTVVS